MAGKKINKTWLIVLFVVLVLTAIAIVVYVAYGKPSTTQNTGTGGSNTPPGYNPNAGAPPEFPLKKGSKNDYVGELQKYMLTRDANCLPKYGVDGDWGNETEACAIKTLGLDVVNYDFYKSLGLN